METLVYLTRRSTGSIDNMLHLCGVLRTVCSKSRCVDEVGFGGLIGAQGV